MEKRKLGSTGFEVAPLALGGNVFGWTADEAMSFQLLDAFVAAGFNLIDTADSYSRWVSGHQGESPKRSSGGGSRGADGTTT
jgi:aryl-alcohol dehydrogenase-like predicted oxidoreductase